MAERNVKEMLSALEFSTVDEMINAIYDTFKISIAIFDDIGILQGLCMKADRCKCYYMLVHGSPNQCSIFNPEFQKAVLAEREVDKNCDYSCRLTSREATINGKLHKLIVFQYNLDTESLEFNPTNSSMYVPLYRGNNPAAADYFWQPTVLTTDEREDIFNFIIEKSADLLMV